MALLAVVIFSFLAIFDVFLKILHKIWKNLIFLPQISYFMTDDWICPKKRNFILILLIQKKIYVMMSTGGDICLIFTKVWLWTLNNISENLWTCILTCCKFSEDLIVQSNTWMQTCGWRVHEIDPWWIGFVFNLNFHKSLRTPLKHFYSGFIKGIFLKKNLSFCN